MKTPDTCPNCGADVPRHAKACPDCGADESTGWSEEAESSHLGLPDETFDYQEFAAREFGKKKALPYGVRWFWWAVALLLASLFILGVFKFTR